MDWVGQGTWPTLSYTQNTELFRARFPSLLLNVILLVNPPELWFFPPTKCFLSWKSWLVIPVTIYFHLLKNIYWVCRYQTPLGKGLHLPPTHLSHSWGSFHLQFFQQVILSVWTSIYITIISLIFLVNSVLFDLDSLSWTTEPQASLNLTEIWQVFFPQVELKLLVVPYIYF